MCLLFTIMKQYGRTPLFWASEGGHTAVVKLLLDNGADVNIRQKVKNTFLTTLKINILPGKCSCVVANTIKWRKDKC